MLRLGAVRLPTYHWAGGCAILIGVERKPTDSCANPRPLPSPCTLPTCRQALYDARQRAGNYRSLHQRALRREAKLKQLRTQDQMVWTARLQEREQQLQQRIDELEAEVRLLKQSLFGRSYEGHHNPNTLAGNASTNADGTAPAGLLRRRRGQQPGRPGHGRRRYDHLPVNQETADLPPQQRCCRTCGQPLAPCGSDPHATTLIEVTVRA